MPGFDIYEFCVCQQVAALSGYVFVKVMSNVHQQTLGYVFPLCISG